MEKFINPLKEWLMICKSGLTHFLHSCKFGDHLHTHTHTYTQDTDIVSFPFHTCLVPILSLSHSHPTRDFPHLETVSLVHQKPLPLGREMHLLCILWSHTSYNFHPSEQGFRFYPHNGNLGCEKMLLAAYFPPLQATTPTPPNTHKRCSHLRYQRVEVRIVLLCYSICMETHVHMTT